MKEKYFLCRVGEDPVEVECDSEHLLEDWYNLINCSCLEFVHCPGGITLIIDECGKIYSNGPLPVNEYATRFYPGAAYGDFIHGDVIFAFNGFRNGEPDIVPLPDSIVRLLGFSCDLDGQ